MVVLCFRGTWCTNSVGCAMSTKKKKKKMKNRKERKLKERCSLVLCTRATLFRT